MPFNSFPSNSLGAGQSEVIVSGGGSTFPILRAKILGSNVRNFSTTLNSTAFEGFAGAGTAVILPSTDNGDIIYQASAQTNIFTVTLANVASAMSGVPSLDSWVGFRMNDAGTLLEGVAIENTAAPDEFYRFTINVAGTVAQVGSVDQPSSDFSTIPTWITSGSSIQVNESTGDLTVLNGAGQIAVIASSGQFTTDPTNPTNAAANQIYSYKTSAGDYVSTFDDTADNVGMMTFRLITSGGSVYTMAVPKSTGIPYSPTVAKIIEWKGYLVPFDDAVIGGAAAFEVLTFSAFITNTKRALGIA